MTIVAYMEVDLKGKIDRLETYPQDSRQILG